MKTAMTKEEKKAYDNGVADKMSGQKPPAVEMCRTYSAYCTDEKTGKRYGIHFTVQTVAIQLNKDDLGNICWDDAVYTCEDY